MAAGADPGDILILAQSRAVGTPIFEAIVATGVPVKSEYTEAELNSREAQRSFALLKLLENRSDRVALRWLIGVNSVTWNAAGFRRVRERSEATGQTPWVVLEQLRDGAIVLPHTGPIVQAFRELFAELAALEALPDLAACRTGSVEVTLGLCDLARRAAAAERTGSVEVMFGRFGM